MNTRVIVISGSMGSGKTTVLGEASDILAHRGVVHSAIDLDAIGIWGLAPSDAKALTYRNLAAIWTNCAAAGVRRLLLAEAIETRDDLEQLRQALQQPEMMVGRLLADVTTLQARVRWREPGMLREEFVQRARTLDATLGRAALENFTVVNDNRAITAVARELLVRAGWIDDRGLPAVNQDGA